MSETPARSRGALRRWVPWLVALVLALVVAAIAVALPHVHRVSQQARDAADASAGTVALPVDYQAAVQAAATEAANLGTYARKSFDADWARSLAGATGNLRKDHESDKAQTRTSLTSKKIDVTATVQHSAFESADEHGTVLALVTMTSVTVDDQGQRGAQTPQRVELTMVKSGGKWLASNLTSIGIQ